MLKKWADIILCQKISDFWSEHISVSAIDHVKNVKKLTTWMKYILSSLSDILSSVLEQDYSAELMWQKCSTESVMLTIQIQSSFEQSEKVQVQIWNQIEQICESNEQSNILMHFLQDNLEFLWDCNIVLRKNTDFYISLQMGLIV